MYKVTKSCFIIILRSEKHNSMDIRPDDLSALSIRQNRRVLCYAYLLKERYYFNPGTKNVCLNIGRKKLKDTLRLIITVSILQTCNYKQKGGFGMKSVIFNQES